jgi:hypothetical protein
VRSNKLFKRNSGFYSVGNKVFNTKAREEIRSIFISDFAPNLDNLIKDVILCNQDNNATNGLFANEDLMHSLMNYVVLQVVNSKFASERYTIKPDGKRGRADIVIEKNGVGVIIEMKYNETAKEGLSQSKHYERLIEKSNIKIFLGCNISSEKEVSFAGKIVGGGETILFEYP